VKAAGFDLVNDQIVGADGSTGDVMGIAASSPVKKRKSPAKKAADREPKKKPKVSEPTVDSSRRRTNQRSRERVARKLKRIEAQSRPGNRIRRGQF
jgi:hypothetical protein